MSIEFSCEFCGKQFKVADAMAGKRAKCNACGGIFRVPSSDDAPLDLSSIETAASSESPSPFEFAPTRPAARASIATQPPAPCPSCHAPLPPGAVLCTACGFDTRKGMKIRGIKGNKPAAGPARNEKEIKWWITILIGVAIIPLTIHQYNDLGRWEAEGGLRVLDEFTSVIYHTLGRVGVLLAGLLLSFFMIGLGVFIRVLETKKQGRVSSSPLKDFLDAAVVLKSPLSKLVLLGSVFANFLLIAAICTAFGFARDDIKQWFLAIFFGALALSLAEFPLWDRLVRKIDEEHQPDNRLLIGGFIGCLLLGTFFGYQAHSEARDAIEQQKRADQTQAEMRRINKIGKDVGPAFERMREMQAAEAAKAERAARAAAAARTLHKSP